MGVTATGQLVAVPQLIGQKEADARRLLTQAKLLPGQRTEDYDPTIPAGSVFWQAQDAGSQVPIATPIDYSVSRGPEPTPSPTANQRIGKKSIPV